MKTKNEAKTRLKALIKYLFRGSWREKAMQLTDIYAIISNKKYEKQVEQLREELVMATTERGLADWDDSIELPTVEAPTGMVVLRLPTDSLQQLELLRQRVQLFPQTLMASGRQRDTEAVAFRHLDLH